MLGIFNCNDTIIISLCQEENKLPVNLLTNDSIMISLINNLADFDISTNYYRIKILINVFVSENISIKG